MNLSLLQNRNFVMFLTRESLMLSGTIFIQISLALYTLSLTGSAGKFASVLAIGIIPHLLLGTFAGVLVDRINKRNLLLLLDVIRGGYLLILFAYSLFEPIDLILIYVTVIVFAACDLFVAPAFGTMLQSIVAKDDLMNANALDVTVVESVRVLAPLLGTIVYSTWGLGAVLLVNVCTTFLSAIATGMIRVKEAIPHHHNTTILQDARKGLQVFVRNPRISSLVLNGILTHIFLFPFVMVGFPYMIKQIFMGSDVDFGIVESAQMAGSLCSILLVAFFMKRYSISANIGLGIVGMIAAVFPLFLLKLPLFVSWMHALPTLVVVFFSGVSFLLFLMFGTYGVFFRTFYQQTVETAMLGRFLSVMAMLFAIGRFAGFHIFGFLFDFTDLLYPIMILGIGMVLKLIVHVPFLSEEKRLAIERRSTDSPLQDR
ncbi:MFS transporter [Brevibacillus sp. SYSU BS000544]|uniref:MFS transporter n=1 Tax=Brevibacillus sp. SYSU BS000544 TaxID=3416443 RepID=UPI003CE5C2BA